MPLFKIFHIDKLWYLFFMSFAAALGLSKFFFFSKIVSVEIFGLYSLVMSIYIFVVFIGGLGLQEGVLKKGSEKYASRDKRVIKEYFINAVVCASLCVISIGIFFLSSMLLLSVNFLTIQLTLVGFLLALSAVQFNLLDAYLRSQQKFILFSLILFFKSLLVLPIGYFLSKKFGASGLLSAEFISCTLVFLGVTVNTINLREIKSDININTIRLLISNGYQMMFAIVVRNISLMMDKWFVALSVGVLALGFYSFSMILLSMTMVALGFIVTLKGPVWISSFQQNKNPKLLFKEISFLVGVINLGLILFFPLFYFFLPDLISYAYPRYSTSEVLLLFNIIYASIIFIVPIYLYDWLFIATSNEKSVLYSNLNSLIFTGIIFLVCWMLKLSVIYFAIAFLVTRIFLTGNYFFYMYKKGFICAS